MSCYGGVGVGHTRETERIKEKMNICERREREHGTKKGQVIMTERQQKQKRTHTHTHRLRL